MKGPGHEWPGFPVCLAAPVRILGVRRLSKRTGRRNISVNALSDLGVRLIKQEVATHLDLRTVFCIYCGNLGA
jgi:hypothetical protein